MANNLKENKIPEAGTSYNRELSNYDPIGSHIIELRRYLHYLEQKLEEKDETTLNFEKQFSTRRGKSKIIEPPVLTIFPPPAFPQNYPFRLVFRNAPRKKGRKLLKYVDDIPKILIDNTRERFVKRVVEQSGFSEIEDESLILNLLSDLVEEYLQKFAKTLVRNKGSEPFAEDKHLWSALQTTLRIFGINGISGLHAFYYDNVVKKHDFLQTKAILMYEEVKKP